MNTLSDFIKLILNKLADFLNIFDLSFFISGTTLISGIFFLVKFKTNYIPQNIFSTINTIYIICISLSCYISGLVCFAIGRKIHNGIIKSKKDRITEDFNDTIKISLENHGINTIKYINGYLNRDNGTLKSSIYRLYPRLWAELRHNTELKNSESILNRYWVMAATYDGLAIALFPWFIILQAPIYNLISLIYPTQHLRLKFISSLMLSFISFILVAKSCMDEAQRYKQYQVEELIATIAYLEQNKLDISCNELFENPTSPNLITVEECAACETKKNDNSSINNILKEFKNIFNK